MAKRMNVAYARFDSYYIFCPQMASVSRRNRGAYDLSSEISVLICSMINIQP